MLFHAQSIMLLTLLILQGSIQISNAQFPTVCMDSNSLSNKKCCPLYYGSEKETHFQLQYTRVGRVFEDFGTYKNT